MADTNAPFIVITAPDSPQSDLAIEFLKKQGYTEISVRPMSWIEARPGVVIKPPMPPTPAPPPVVIGPVISPVLPLTAGDMGIDISKYQPDVRWDALRQADKKFVYIKATEGLTGKDPLFDKHWATAKREGFLRGAYHFYRYALDPEKQAEWFVAQFINDKGELPPALDVELAPSDNPVVNKTIVTENILRCLNKIEQLAGVKPIIYTSANMWNKMTTEPAWGINFKLWVAHYTDRIDPFLPQPWRSKGTWTFWQYSGSGQIPGNSGLIDLNRYRGE